jgi:hypothetical protein
MTGKCCVAGRAPERLARRLSKVAAATLPAAVLVFLPKCPLCFAAWLTLATGFSFSATGVLWVRAGIVLWPVAAVGILSNSRTAPMRLAIWRRAFAGLSTSYGAGKKLAR